MSDPIASSTFLERRSYRRRRVLDCLRVLPVLGMWLWLVPMLWQRDGADPMTLSFGLIYVFAVWATLVILAGAMVAVLKVTEKRPETGEHHGDA